MQDRRYLAPGQPSMFLSGLPFECLQRYNPDEHWGVGWAV